MGKRKAKITPEQAIITEGLVTGLFFTLYLKTGVSYDPYDLLISATKQIEVATQSMPHAWNTPSYFPLISALISIIGILSLIATIFSIKNKCLGLGIFLVGFFISFVIVIYAFH